MNSFPEVGTLLEPRLRPTGIHHGYNAVGEPIPHYRRSAGLRCVREMVPDMGTEEAHGLVERTANALERDDLFMAQRAAMSGLDLTGAYRLLAVLLTEPK